jgi:hypothetical protein
LGAFRDYLEVLKDAGKKAEECVLYARLRGEWG